MRIDDNTHIDVSYAEDLEVFEYILLSENDVLTIYVNKEMGGSHLVRFDITGISDALNQTPCEF